MKSRRSHKGFAGFVVPGRQGDPVLADQAE
jgi:hypothetical protein